jgi:hypothetical protein
MAKVNRESRWNGRHEYGANHIKEAPDRHCQELPKEERPFLYGLGKRSRDWFDHVLHQAIPRDKKIEIWENTLHHYCGHDSKRHHPEHHGYQWKDRDMPEPQAGLQWYLAEGPRIIQKVGPLSGSTQANEFFQVVKGMYTDKRLNFAILTELRFALGVMSQSRNPGWHDELRDP